MFYHPFDMPFPPKEKTNQKEFLVDRQFNLPRKLDYLARRYPMVTWNGAQELYAQAVQEVIDESGEKDLLSGKLSFGRGWQLAEKRFIELLDETFPNDGKGRFYF